MNEAQPNLTPDTEAAPAIIDSVPGVERVPELAEPAPAAELGSRENPIIVPLPNGSTTNSANKAASTVINDPTSLAMLRAAAESMAPSTADAQAAEQSVVDKL